MAVLDGVLVVALEQAVAAPYCTSRLADAGARVIKVERAEGDFARTYDRAASGTSSYFAWLNRGKESIVLDVKAPEDRALLDALIARADVFVQNLAPGATTRLGIGADALRTKHPALITVDISSYGAGPFASRKGYDLLIQGESGLASITGGADGPGRVGVSVCDIATGMYAWAGVLEALIARGATGQGQAIEVSLFDALADWMTVPLLQAEHAGRNPPRLGLHHASIAPYGAYPCANGASVMFAIQNDREWRRFCTQVLNLPDIADDPRFIDTPARVAHRPALDAIITSAFATLDRADVVARLEAADIAFGAVNTALELADHPHLRRTTVATPSGTATIVEPPIVRDGARAALRDVPRLGEHTAAIRAEFLKG